MPHSFPSSQWFAQFRFNLKFGRHLCFKSHGGKNKKNIRKGKEVKIFSDGMPEPVLVYDWNRFGGKTPLRSSILEIMRYEKSP